MTAATGGAKWEPGGLNGRIDVAWFDLRKTNALTVDPNSIFNQIQNGEVTSRGIERAPPLLRGARVLCRGMSLLWFRNSARLFRNRWSRAWIRRRTSSRTP